jgi:hypothetical protein
MTAARMRLRFLLLIPHARHATAKLNGRPQPRRTGKKLPRKVSLVARLRPLLSRLFKEMNRSRKVDSRRKLLPRLHQSIPQVQPILLKHQITARLRHRLPLPPHLLRHRLGVLNHNS